MTEFYVQFGLRVKNARSLVGLSQSELATRLGVARSSVANIESGRQRMPLHQLPLLATILEISVDDLIETGSVSNSPAVGSSVSSEVNMKGISDTARRFLEDALSGNSRGSANGAA